MATYAEYQAQVMKSTQLANSISVFFIMLLLCFVIFPTQAFAYFKAEFYTTSGVKIGSEGIQIEATVGSSVGHTVFLKNIGTESFTPKLGVGPSDIFTVSDSCGTLSPNESCNVTVTFEPLQAEERTGMLSLKHPDPTSLGPLMTLAIHANATGYVEPVSATPSGLSVTATGSSTIAVSWNSASGAARYWLERKNVTTGVIEQAFCGTGTSLSDSGLSAGTTYQYRVKAGNADSSCVTSTGEGWSNFSNIQEATTEDNTTPSTATLILNQTGTGNGSLHVIPADIHQCDNPNCQPLEYALNQSVTIIAEPDANSVVDDWTNCQSLNQGKNCNLTLTQDTTVSVTFTEDTGPKTLTVTGTHLLDTDPGKGAIKIEGTTNVCTVGNTCTYTFDHGTVVTLRALPANNSLFNTWQGACDQIIDDTHCVVTLNSNTHIFGYFALNHEPVLSLTTVPNRLAMPGQAYTLGFTALDQDDNLDRIEINWTGAANNTGQVQSKLANSGEEISFTYTYPSNEFVIWTATAYDSKGKASDTLRNGMWVGPPPRPTLAYRQKCPTGDPIDLSTGAQYLDHALLSVRGAVSLSAGISYNSQVLANNGVVGASWNLNSVNTRLETLTEGDVKVYWDDVHYNIFVLSGDGRYYPDNHTCGFDNLEKNSDGSYTLGKKTGVIYEFDAGGRLIQLHNKQNQAVNLEYDSENRVGKLLDPVSGAYLQYTYNSDGLLHRVSDIAGRQVTLEYDANRHLIEIMDAAGQTTTYTYNNDGRIVSGVDGDAQTLFTNVFDAQGRVTEQDDGLDSNEPIRIIYGDPQANGDHAVTVTNREGETEVYTFTAAAQLLSIQDPLGHATVTEYNGAGKAVAVTDANGHTSHIEYDSNGNPNKIIDAKGNTALTLTYDGNDNLIVAENALGKQTQISYDTDNQVIAYTNAAGQTTHLSYTAEGKVQSITRPGGGTTAYAYADGLPVSITDADGHTRTLAYDAAGRVTGVTDADGNTTQIEYDGVNRITAVTDALGRTVSMTYNSRGQVLTFTDAKGNLTTREYDGNGKLVALTDALNHITHYEYDGEDRLVKVIDALGHAAQLAYDAKGRLVSVTDALGNTASLEYDAADRLLKQFDALGNPVARFVYDELGNVLTVSDALGNPSHFDYDALSRLTGVADPLDRVTQFSHDDLDRLQQSVDAIGGSSSQDFDADGNRTALQDPNANTTAFEFDASGRLTAVNVAGTGQVQYHYNSRDLLEQVVNARGQQREFNYDAAGRLTAWSDPDGEVSIAYDANDNVLGITGAQGSASYEYDALDRVVKYTDVLGNVFEYAYDAAGRLVTLTYPGGKQVQYGYDAAGRLVQVSDWAGRVTAYQYDANGRLLQTAYANGSVETRSYDSAGQLTRKGIRDAGGALIVQYDYSYDPAGNIVEEALTPAAVEAMIETALDNISPMDFSYGAANRLATYSGEATQFDADGNMVHGPLNGEMVDFHFDSRNRLTEVGAMAYRYDAQNHRIGVSVSGAETTYAVNPLPALSQVLVRTKPDGEQTYYVYGLGLIAEERGGAYQVYHYDLRGSTVALSDAQGAVTEQLAYSPYAGLLSHSPAEVDTPFLYNGRDGVMTDDTGLYYMRARYYDPEIRRFVNQDVLLGMVADGQSLNRYAYVTGGAISYVDPFGLAPLTEEEEKVLEPFGKAADTADVTFDIAKEAAMLGDATLGDVHVKNPFGFREKAINLFDDYGKKAGWIGTIINGGLEANTGLQNIEQSKLDPSYSLYTAETGATGVRFVGKSITGLSEMGWTAVYYSPYLSPTVWVDAAMGNESILKRDIQNFAQKKFDTLDEANSYIDEVTGENICELFGLCNSQTSQSSSVLKKGRISTNSFTNIGEPTKIITDCDGHLVKVPRF